MPAKKNDSKVETPAVPEAAVQVTPEKDPPRLRNLSASVLGLGLIFGMLQSYFFYGHALGISYPLFMALALCTLWFLGEYLGKPMKKSELPWVLGILFFSPSRSCRIGHERSRIFGHPVKSHLRKSMTAPRNCRS